MSIRTKNILFVLALVLIFVGLGLWYIYAKPHPALPQVSTTSAPTSSTSPNIPAIAPAAPEHIIDSGQYYTSDLQYPSATPLATTAGSAANASAVQIMKTFSQNTLATFLKYGQFNTLTPAEAADQGISQNQKFSISDGYTTYSGASTVSYVFDINEVTLGAHPVSTYQTFTFDDKTGAQVQLSDLFVPGTNYLSELSMLSRSTLTSQLGSNADQTFIDAGTSPTASNFQDFAIGGNNLMLIFPPYKVGPGSLGAQTIQIPLSQLNNILTPSYQ